MIDTSASQDGTPLHTAPWSALDGLIEGRVVLPDHRDYEQARKGPIARFHHVMPAAIVFCRSAGDVAEAVSFARHWGISPAVRSGGHCFAGYSTGPGMVLDVSPIGTITVADGAATIGAGARLGEVYDALDQYSLTIPGGCGPTVGIAGLTLGGGLGVLGRSHGLTADNLVAAEVVLAEGRIVVCDTAHEPDLFWALRGAGARGLGVVTHLVFRTIPAPEVTCFHLTWPPRLLTRVVDGWQEWAPAAPDDLAASLLVTVAGGEAPNLDLFGAMVGDEPKTHRYLGELLARLGVEPETSFRQTMPYRDAKRYLAELGGQFENRWKVQMPNSGHGYSKSEYFRESLPEEAVDALIDRLTRGTAPGQVRQLDFTPWGCAYNRVKPNATAFPHREELFLLKQELIVEPSQPQSLIQLGRSWLQDSWEAVHRWGSGGVYPNFPDPDLKDSGYAYYRGNHERVSSVKTTYDPGNLFSSSQQSGSGSPGDEERRIRQRTGRGSTSPD